MTKNIGMIDRFVRVVVGLGIVYWAVRHGSWWGMIGVVLLITAAMQYCCLYKLFGFKTCGAKTCGTVRERK